MDETTDPLRHVRDQLAYLLPGYRLDDRPVSSTAMSQVFLATDARLHQRKVAVKAMAGYLSAHPAYRKRFLREIQLMAGLEHPNIMYVVTAASEQDHLLYLVMPCAEGDLKALLVEGPLDLARTVEVVAQVAKALDFAHEHGVVHRDVKPGNILFGTGGHVYLSDFGVAKPQFGEDLTLASESVGTRRYTAPEVYGAGRSAEDRGDGRAGDVYSLGAVLYHCLTGKRPFDTLDDSAAEAAQRRGELPPVSELRPQLPAAFDALTAKAMHRDPAKRHGSCGELARALAQTVGVTETGSALPILRDIQERLREEAAPPERARRRDLINLLTPVFALVLLAGVLLYSASSGGEEDGTAAEAATAEANGGSEVAPVTPDPVTGDERASRRPVAGECIDDSEEWYVVACDSEPATERVYRVATLPEDPNPSQADHDDATWAVCAIDGISDFNSYFDDNADTTGGAWDPETGVVYYIICTQDL